MLFWTSRGKARVVVGALNEDAANRRIEVMSDDFMLTGVVLLAIKCDWFLEYSERALDDCVCS